MKNIEETKYSAFNILNKTDYDKLVGYHNDFHKEVFFYKSLCEAELFSEAEKRYIKCMKLNNNISHLFLTEEVKEDFSFVEYIRDCVEEYKKDDQKREYR